MHRLLMTAALAALLTVGACGEENLTFPGADGSNQSGATSGEPTPTPEPGSTPSPTESPTPEPTVTFCVGQGDPCGALADGASCCPGFTCAGICVPSG